MGGGISRHELAAAVSEAGGLGTIAVGGAEAIERELAAARALTDRPIAVNVLLPFARRDWFEAASRRRRRRHLLGGAEAPHSRHLDPPVRLGRGGARRPRRRRRRGDRPGGRGGRARARHRAGPGAPRARPGGDPDPDFPLLLAGGIAERADVQRALEAGAAAAVAGTRFLLSPESRAHPDYKRRLLTAEETLLTELFGFGWPAPHRVVANAATERQLGGGRRAAAQPGAQPPRRARRPLHARPPPSCAWPGPSDRGAACSRPSARPTTAPRTCSTPARSMRARPWRASTTSAPRPTSSPPSRPNRSSAPYRTSNSGSVR